MLIGEVAEDLRWMFVRALVYELKLAGAAEVRSVLFAVGRSVESRHQFSSSDVDLTLWKVPHG